MKKCSLFAAAMLCILLLSACGNSTSFTSNSPRTQADVKRDLEQSEAFWNMVAPAAPDAYRLTDVTVLAQFTEPEEHDVLSVSVTAQSDVATYTGVLSASYDYIEGQGYVLARILQGSPGSYSDIQLPDGSLASTFWNMAMAEVNGTLQETSVEGIASDETHCKLKGTFDYRDDALHFTGTISAYVTATFADGAWQILTSDPIYGQSPITVEAQSGRFDPANEVYWSNNLGLEIINAYYVDGHQYYDRFSYYSSADLTTREVIKYGFQNVEKHVLADDAYMGSDGVGFLSTSTGPMSEADIYPYLDMIKASDPNVLIITDARQYLREVLIQPDYMIVAKEYTDENGLHVAELATKGTDGYAAAMG